jgi:hypothetical protein
MEGRHGIFTLIWLWLLLCILAGSGCTGPHYRQHQLVLFGRRAPVLTEPIAAAVQAHLATNPIPEAKWEGSFSAVVVSIFKGFGVQGWTDFHLPAEAHGRVLYHRTSSDGFTTIDLKLNSLQVAGETVPLPNYRFIRAEVFRGRVPLDKLVLEDVDTAIMIRGKLVWDNDGWFEIHPQKPGDVQAE